MASALILLLAVTGCSPAASGPSVVVTPPPTTPPPAWPTATPWPVRSFDPYGAIEVSRDGTWRVISPDGTSLVIDPRDVLGDDPPAPTGVAGRVITVAGAPVAGAVIVHRTSAGEPCSPYDVATLTGPQGFFQAHLSPGLCSVSAKPHGRATPEVAVEIGQGRLTVVTLVMP